MKEISYKNTLKIQLQEHKKNKVFNTLAPSLIISRIKITTCSYCLFQTIEFSLQSQND